MLNEEVNLYANFGTQDEGWRFAESGELGANGKPAWYTVLKAWGDTQNDHWAQTGPAFRSSVYRLSQTSKSELDLEPWLYEQTKDYEPYRQPLEDVVPPLIFTAEQSQELADLNQTISQYVTEMSARFITGDADLENGWEEYLATLEQMGLPRLLEIHQEAYEAATATASN